MQSTLPFFPVQASNFAGNVDALFSFILLTCVFFSVLVTLLIILAALKYKRKSAGEVGSADHGNMVLEVGWTVIPLVIALGMFAWGAVIYVNYRVAPKDTLDIYVIGKQWMWKLQQPNGRKEINELHVPVDRNIKLIMGSEDVIHDFYVPAFRVKWMWFPAATTPCGSGQQKSASIISSVRSIAAPIMPSWVAGWRSWIRRNMPRGFRMKAGTSIRPPPARDCFRSWRATPVTLAMAPAVDLRSTAFTETRCSWPTARW